MVDQFISCSETKWQRMNGLVLLLPHGYEGQGPEHSNARPERYLQLSAEYNMVVANITTPANFFHVLRRQLTWEFRKPLVIMSPKSLLRHPKVFSPLEEFTSGNFKEVIGDDYATANTVKRVLFCTGKIYYDLLERQEAEKRKDVAIVRVEQIQPFPINQVNEILSQYKNAELFWVQEEPENMGYWSFILRAYKEVSLSLISRKASASPATGYAKVHAAEQQKLVDQAFAKN
jgi:2-oxoglutarate dehydrogenase E1 component